MAATMLVSRVQSLWRGSKYLLVLFAFLVTAVAIFRTGQRDSRAERLELPFMSVHYEKIDLRASATAASLSTPYSLYRYDEGTQHMDQQVSPMAVLFLPGNAGSYEQVRSLASWIANEGQARQFGAATPMVYAIDWQEEMSAFSARLLERQAGFAAIAIRHLVGHVKHRQIILAAHSMGGIVARLTIQNLAQHGIDASAILGIITLCTPHQGMPVFTSHSMHGLYKQLNQQEPKSSVPLISLAAGEADVQIADVLTMPVKAADLWTKVESIPAVWARPSHQSAVWAHSIVRLITDFFFALALGENESGRYPQKNRFIETANEYFNARELLLADGLEGEEVVFDEVAMIHEPHEIRLAAADLTCTAGFKGAIAYAIPLGAGQKVSVTSNLHLDDEIVVLLAKSYTVQQSKLTIALSQSQPTTEFMPQKSYYGQITLRTGRKLHSLVYRITMWKKHAQGSDSAKYVVVVRRCCGRIAEGTTAMATLPARLKTPPRFQRNYPFHDKFQGVRDIEAHVNAAKFVVAENADVPAAREIASVKGTWTPPCLHYGLDMILAKHTIESSAGNSQQLIVLSPNYSRHYVLRATLREIKRAVPTRPLFSPVVKVVHRCLPDAPTTYFPEDTALFFVAPCSNAKSNSPAGAQISLEIIADKNTDYQITMAVGWVESLSLFIENSALDALLLMYSTLLLQSLGYGAGQATLLTAALCFGKSAYERQGFFEAVFLMLLASSWQLMFIAALALLFRPSKAIRRSSFRRSCEAAFWLEPLHAAVLCVAAVIIGIPLHLVALAVMALSLWQAAGSDQATTPRQLASVAVLVLGCAPKIAELAMLLPSLRSSCQSPAQMLGYLETLTEGSRRLWHIPLGLCLAPRSITCARRPRVLRSIAAGALAAFVMANDRRDIHLLFDVLPINILLRLV